VETTVCTTSAGASIAGFNKYERGPVVDGRMQLRLTDIGRVKFTRDLPVLDVGGGVNIAQYSMTRSYGALSA
jgi:hypothetical protein